MIESFRGIGTILMLHRVHPYEANRLLHNENMKISPVELESIIVKLKRDNVIFTSLDQLINNSRKQRLSQRFIAFTLDDGYRDNLEYAFPIFKKHEIPFCIYVTNSFPNRSTNLWWYALEKLILQNEFLKLPGGRTGNKTLKQKNRNFLQLRRNIINKHFSDPISYLQQVGNLEFDLKKEIQEKCLNWDEIIRLSDEPLVTIGCHTMNHLPLSKLDSEQVRAEINNSKLELEQKLNRSVNHFAFPFGSRFEAGPREYRISQQAGFQTITTAVHGHIHKNHNLMRLNRVFLFPLKNNRTTLSRVLYWNLKSCLAFIRNILHLIRGDK